MWFISGQSGNKAYSMTWAQRLKLPSPETYHHHQVYLNTSPSQADISTLCWEMPCHEHDIQRRTQSFGKTEFASSIFCL